VLPVCNAREDLPLGRSITFQPIRDNGAWNAPHPVRSQRQYILAACLSRRSCTRMSSTLSSDRRPVGDNGAYVIVTHRSSRCYLSTGRGKRRGGRLASSCPTFRCYLRMASWSGEPCVPTAALRHPD